MKRSRETPEYFDIEYQNGVRKEFYILNDKLHGEYKEYYPSGQIKIDTTYKYNKIDGDYREYYRDGKLKLKVITITVL